MKESRDRSSGKSLVDYRVQPNEQLSAGKTNRFIQTLSNMIGETAQSYRRNNNQGLDKYGAFEVYSLGEFQVRVAGGYIYQSMSAHASAKTMFEYIHINTTSPGSAPYDLTLAFGDNWIYLSKELLGENPTSMSPPAPSQTTNIADTYKSIILAYVYVDPADQAGNIMVVTLYHEGNVFTDNNFNIRSTGSFVGYKAEITAAEVATDLAFKMIAGPDPILTIFKGSTDQNFTAYKADYIGMLSADGSGPEVAISRTSGKYTSIKPAYLEMRNDAADRLITIDATTGQIITNKTSGKQTSVEPAYIFLADDAGTRTIAIDAINTSIDLELPGGHRVYIGDDSFAATTIKSTDGTKVSSMSEGNLTIRQVASTDEFNASGGDLTGHKSGRDYALRQIDYLNDSGVSKTIWAYCTTPAAGPAHTAFTGTIDHVIDITFVSPDLEKTVRTGHYTNGVLMTLDAAVTTTITTAAAC